MELVTTDSKNRQLFRLLPPGWLEDVTVYPSLKSDVNIYQWRFGMNPLNDQWLKPIVIGSISYACYTMTRHVNINIHQCTLCWVGAPQNTIAMNYRYVYASQAVVYRAMTVDELRKTGDPMYRVVIAYAVSECPNILHTVSLVTELDCICYIMSIDEERELVTIPKYVRTVIVQFFARIMFPNNTAFLTDKGAVNELMNTMLFDHPRTQLKNYCCQGHMPNLIDKPASHIVTDLRKYLETYYDYVYSDESE